MKKLILYIIALAALPGGALFAQKIADTWQGTLQTPTKPLRIVLKVSRAADESLKATMYSIDQGGQPINASAISLQGSTFKMAVAAIGGEYEGKLGPDGNSITGTWTQGGGSMALNLARATAETAWAIPEPPPPPKQMPENATPTFEVSTVKPSTQETGLSILVGRGGGNLFTTTNTSLADLVKFAYGVHARQVAGGPSWMESEKFDVTAKPDLAGSPNVTQLRSMVQKLLADRFHLEFHREKRELSAYALGTAKGGVKITKTEGAGGKLPGFGGRGPGAIAVRNATMAEFAEFLQSRVVERPVVDQTGLADRYDFTLKWTPDVAQMAALAGPNAPPPPPPAADAPPDLFAAFQQQLGLKLESTKAPVEVLVIDRAEKPTEN